MSTYAELRQEILGVLGASPDSDTDSDIRTLVDVKMKRKRDEMYGLKPPRSLLVYSSTVDVPEDLEYIQITGTTAPTTPSFGISNLLEVFTLTIGASDSTQDEEEDWDFREYTSWIRENSAVSGNQRLPKTFTIDYQNRIFLRNLPGTGETWKARLHYYKQPETIADGVEPEFEPKHEGTYVRGVALEFPNLFRGQDRAAIYAAMLRMYADGIKAYVADQTIIKTNLRLRPAERRKGTSSVVWPSPIEA